MNPTLLHPITEMRRFFGGALREFRGARNVDGELIIEGALDIQTDVEKVATEIREGAQAAETYDLEALAKIEEAQRPDSDGGTSITPKELRKIKPLILKSATLDHDASQLAKFDAA